MPALRRDGITAPFVIDRPMNGVIFRTYVERVLAPTLSPGDIVILDNLGSHKGTEARRLIEARRGAQLIFLPPYSPDLNPIELAFAKLKAMLRKAAERSGRRPLGAHRRPSRQLLCRRMHKLLQTCRLCVKLNGIVR